MESRLNTRPYAAADDGTVRLPPHVRLQVWPVYWRPTQQGRRAVDERITIVVEDRPDDSPAGFLPVVLRMSVAEAERVHSELRGAIAEPKPADGTE